MSAEPVRLPLTDAVKCVAGADLPYLMNALVGRVLDDRVRARLHQTAVDHLVSKLDWLTEVRDLKWDVNSSGLDAWIRKQTIANGLFVYVPLLELQREFPLRDILFVVYDGSFVTGCGGQRMHNLLEFLMDVPNELPLGSPGRRHQAREALLKRLPQLRDVAPPWPPLTERQQEPWFVEQELRFGTALPVTAFPPKPRKAQTVAPTAPVTDTRILMHHDKVGAYS